MIKKILAATTAAMMCTAAGTNAFAQESDEHEGNSHMRGIGHRMNHDDFGDPERMLKKMTRHLDLDETQTQNIENIMTAAKPEIDALRERAQATRKAMHDLDVSDPGYGTDLQNLSTQIGALTAEATLLHGRLRADVLAQLTDEQRERAAEGRRKMSDRFGHGGFRRRHGHLFDSSESE